jgi:ribosome biogenesis protein ERB1
MHWYDDMPHIGYDIDGKQVFRPAKGDELDKFLSAVDDPSAWCPPFLCCMRPLAYACAAQDRRVG